MPTRQRNTVDHAANWAFAIKQALMPVTPQSSQQSAASNLVVSTTTEGRLPPSGDMAQLKVPGIIFIKYKS